MTYYIQRSYVAAMTTVLRAAIITGMVLAYLQVLVVIGLLVAVARFLF